MADTSPKMIKLFFTMSKFINYTKPINNAVNTLKTVIHTLLLLPLPYTYFNDVNVNALRKVTEIQKLTSM